MRQTGYKFIHHLLINSIGSQVQQSTLSFRPSLISSFSTKLPSSIPNSSKIKLVKKLLNRVTACPLCPYSLHLFSLVKYWDTQNSTISHLKDLVFGIIGYNSHSSFSLPIASSTSSIEVFIIHWSTKLSTSLITNGSCQHHTPQSLSIP